MFDRVKLVRVQVCSAPLDQSEFVRQKHEPDQTCSAFSWSLIEVCSAVPNREPTCSSIYPDTALSGCFFFSATLGPAHAHQVFDELLLGHRLEHHSAATSFLGNIHACHLLDESPTRALSGSDQAFSAAARLYSSKPRTDPRSTQSALGTDLIYSVHTSAIARSIPIIPIKNPPTDYPTHKSTRFEPKPDSFHDLVLLFIMWSNLLSFHFRHGRTKVCWHA